MTVAELNDEILRIVSSPHRYCRKRWSAISDESSGNGFQALIGTVENTRETLVVILVLVRFQALIGTVENSAR
jgi:hypothetical protein